MGKFSRQKGNRGEREVVELFRTAGFDAKRVPLSGAARGFPGDVVAGDMTVQVKLGGHVPVSLYKWLEGADVLLCRRDREEWLVVQRWKDWVACREEVKNVHNQA